LQRNAEVSNRSAMKKEIKCVALMIYERRNTPIQVNKSFRNTPCQWHLFLPPGQEEPQPFDNVHESLQYAGRSSHVCQNFEEGQMNDSAAIRQQ